MCILIDLMFKILFCLHLQPRKIEIRESFHVNVHNVIVLKNQPFKMRQILQRAGSNKRQFVICQESGNKQQILLNLSNLSTIT